jgi:glycine betaine/choline ABC-type transport system substrate-binding protein
MFSQFNNGRHRGVPALRLVVLATLVASLVAAVTASAARSERAKTPVIVGSKDFTEQFILAELYGQALEAKGFDVTVKSNLGSTSITDGALKKGDIDVYPEYTGTMYLAVCKLTYQPGLAFSRLFARDQACYRKRGLRLLPTGQFNDGNAIACTQKFTSQNHVTTISDLKRVAAQTRYATIAEQLTRADGIPWIKKHYGFEFGQVKTYDFPLRYKAVENGNADCVYAFGTDAQIQKLKLVVLRDDKRIWAFDRVAPVVRPSWLRQQSPQFAQILARVNSMLDDKTMTSLNAKVDLNKEDPKDVAHDWLETKGML